MHIFFIYVYLYTYIQKSTFIFYLYGKKTVMCAMLTDWELDRLHVKQTGRETIASLLK